MNKSLYLITPDYYYKHFHKNNPAPLIRERGHTNIIKLSVSVKQIMKFILYLPFMRFITALAI